MPLNLTVNTEPFFLSQQIGKVLYRSDLVRDFIKTDKLGGGRSISTVGAYAREKGRVVAVRDGLPAAHLPVTPLAIAWLIEVFEVFEVFRLPPPGFTPGPAACARRRPRATTKEAH